MKNQQSIPRRYRFLRRLAAAFAAVLLCGTAFVTSPAAAGPRTVTMWINHLDFAPTSGGIVRLVTSPDEVPVSVGLTGLHILSSNLGDTDSTGQNKEIMQGLQVPPGYLIKGVRICYEQTSSASFITQIRLAQLQDPPSTAMVLLDDGTDHTAVGPVCVDSATTTVDPSLGAVRLSLRINTGNTLDVIVLRGVALHLEPRHRH